MRAEGQVGVGEEQVEIHRRAGARARCPAEERLQGGEVIVGPVQAVFVGGPQGDEETLGRRRTAALRHLELRPDPVNLMP
jgi:hypothetical protein